MARFKLSFFFILSVLLHAAVSLPHLVHSNDENEDNLLQGINCYRASLNLSALTKNDKAGCLADKIADVLGEEPCSNTTFNAMISANFNDLVSECKIDVNTTTDSVVLRVCVPELVPTLVLTNYTHTNYTGYLNNSKYTGVGIGSKNDLTVMVLSTSNVEGSFANEATSLVSKCGFGISQLDGFAFGIACLFGVLVKVLFSPFESLVDFIILSL